MGNKRFDYHEYLRPNHLTQNNNNVCFKCGKKLGNIRPDKQNATPIFFHHFNTTDCILVGFVHNQCLPPSQEDENLI
jgi:hypothetical protein